MPVPFCHGLLACAAIATSLAGAPTAYAADPPRVTLDHPIVFTQLPVWPTVEGQAELRNGTLRTDYDEGGRIVCLDPDGRSRILTERFASAVEPDISFDGTRILFAGQRRAGDAWNIWEMSADGGDERQITKDHGNCRNPAYLGLMYSIGPQGDNPAPMEPWRQIVFVSDAAGTMNEAGSGRAMHLYSCKLDGSLVHRLTFNPSSDFDPFLMDDGRLLLASWQRFIPHQGFDARVALFGLNTDGTDYALFCGDQGRRVKQMPCVTTDGLAVFIETDEAPWDGAGQLAAVSLRRNFHSYRTLTDDPRVLYHSPAPLGDGTILVSFRAVAERPATTQPSKIGESPGGAHGIVRFDPKTGWKELVFDDPQFHDINAKALTPRQQPDGRSSSVHEEYRTGKLYCLNAAHTDPQYRGSLEPGRIKAVRVLEGLPLPGRQPNGRPIEQELGRPGTARKGPPALAQRRLLGQAPVEEDGSFHLEVPADTPIELQLLDEDGLAMRSCGWIWVRPRQANGCIGCHEDPELVPENRFVKALQKPAVQLTLPPEKRRTVDFRRDVMPIITSKCASCHTGREGSLDLRSDPTPHFNRAYETLLAPTMLTPGKAVGTVSEPPASARAVFGKYIVPGEARTSPFVWWMLGRNTTRPWDAASSPARQALKHPTEDMEPLTENEIRIIVEWIDLGAPWGGIPDGGGARRAATASGVAGPSTHTDGGPKEGATP